MDVNQPWTYHFSCRHPNWSVTPIQFFLDWLFFPRRTLLFKALTIKFIWLRAKSSLMWAMCIVKIIHWDYFLKSQRGVCKGSQFNIHSLNDTQRWTRVQLSQFGMKPGYKSMTNIIRYWIKSRPLHFKDLGSEPALQTSANIFPSNQSRFIDDPWWHNGILRGHTSR